MKSVPSDVVTDIQPCTGLGFSKVVPAKSTRTRRPCCSATWTKRPDFATAICGEVMFSPLRTIVSMFTRNHPAEELDVNGGAVGPLGAGVTLSPLWSQKWATARAAPCSNLSAASPLPSDMPASCDLKLWSVCSPPPLAACSISPDLCPVVCGDSGAGDGDGDGASSPPSMSPKPLPKKRAATAAAPSSNRFCASSLSPSPPLGLPPAADSAPSFALNSASSPTSAWLSDNPTMPPFGDARLARRRPRCNKHAVAQAKPTPTSDNAKRRLRACDGGGPRNPASSSALS
mmetsp:Transcript_125430/g.360400  ORF Transcript_125430/g.360400 Transcript_125430/m.360400 type:complete len:288 (+) Transcript_125430:490-1353(+)